MELENLIGHEITEIIRGHNIIEIRTKAGILRISEGDCGTMRDPEPYFSVEALPVNHCKKWAGFSRCGHELPCPYHGAEK